MGPRAGEGAAAGSAAATGTDDSESAAPPSNMRIAGEYMEILDAATSRFEEAEAEEGKAPRQRGAAAEAGEEANPGLPTSSLASSHLRRRSTVVIEVDKLVGMVHEVTDRTLRAARSADDDLMGDLSTSQASTMVAVGNDLHALSRARATMLGPAPSDAARRAARDAEEVERKLSNRVRAQHSDALERVWRSCRERGNAAEASFTEVGDIVAASAKEAMFSQAEKFRGHVEWLREAYEDKLSVSRTASQAEAEAAAKRAAREKEEAVEAAARTAREEAAAAAEAAQRRVEELEVAVAAARKEKDDSVQRLRRARAEVDRLTAHGGGGGGMASARSGLSGEDSARQRQRAAKESAEREAEFGSLSRRYERALQDLGTSTRRAHEEERRAEAAEALAHRRAQQLAESEGAAAEVRASAAHWERTCAAALQRAEAAEGRVGEAEAAAVAARQEGRRATAAAEEAEAALSEARSDAAAASARATEWEAAAVDAQRGRDAAVRLADARELEAAALRDRVATVRDEVRAATRRAEAAEAAHGEARSECEVVRGRVAGQEQEAQHARDRLDTAEAALASLRGEAAALRRRAARSEWAVHEAERCGMRAEDAQATALDGDRRLTAAKEELERAEAGVKELRVALTRSREHASAATARAEREKVSARAATGAARTLATALQQGSSGGGAAEGEAVRTAVAYALNGGEGGEELAARGTAVSSSGGGGASGEGGDVASLQARVAAAEERAQRAEAAEMKAAGRATAAESVAGAARRRAESALRTCKQLREEVAAVEGQRAQAEERAREQGALSDQVAALQGRLVEEQERVKEAERRAQRALDDLAETQISAWRARVERAQQAREAAVRECEALRRRAGELEQAVGAREATQGELRAMMRGKDALLAQLTSLAAAYKRHIEDGGGSPQHIARSLDQGGGGDQPQTQEQRQEQVDPSQQQQHQQQQQQGKLRAAPSHAPAGSRPVTVPEAAAPRGGAVHAVRAVRGAYGAAGDGSGWTTVPTGRQPASASQTLAAPRPRADAGPHNDSGGAGDGEGGDAVPDPWRDPARQARPATLGDGAVRRSASAAVLAPSFGKPPPRSAGTKGTKGTASLAAMGTLRRGGGRSTAAPQTPALRAPLPTPLPTRTPGSRDAVPPPSTLHQQRWAGRRSGRRPGATQ